MKYILFIFASFVLTSCDDKDAGGCSYCLKEKPDCSKVNECDLKYCDCEPGCNYGCKTP